MHIEVTCLYRLYTLWIPMARFTNLQANSRWKSSCRILNGQQWTVTWLLIFSVNHEKLPKTYKRIRPVQLKAVRVMGIVIWTIGEIAAWLHVRSVSWQNFAFQTFAMSALGIRLCPDCPSAAESRSCTALDRGLFSQTRLEMFRVQYRSWKGWKGWKGWTTLLRSLEIFSHIIWIHLICWNSVHILADRIDPMSFLALPCNQAARTAPRTRTHRRTSGTKLETIKQDD